MEVLAGEQTFLLVRWLAAELGDGGPVAFEAMLCRRHREVIWCRHSNLTGCRQLGNSCDLCEGRAPMRV
jgi:hypothetical protein